MPDKLEILGLDQEKAGSFARQALACISREYPNALGHVLNSEGDIRSPRALHPAFYGCFDWHSSVHSHWMLVRLLRLFPGLPEEKSIREALNANLTAANLQTEADYFTHPNRQSFERMYGWAWLLKLTEELYGWPDRDGTNWLENLKPLTAVLVARYLAFLPHQTYPIRAGTHPNTAFGLALGLDYARTCRQPDLEELILERSLTYFAGDKDYPARWEPNGGDFFSPALTEADLLSRVMSPGDFQAWFRGFLPDVPIGEPANLFNPVIVANRTDPVLGHLDGIQLTRAWCMRRIAAALPPDDPARPVLLIAAQQHAAEGLKHVFSEVYNSGAHWLASFAVYLLT